MAWTNGKKGDYRAAQRNEMLKQKPRVYESDGERTKTEITGGGRRSLGIVPFIKSVIGNA